MMAEDAPVPGSPVYHHRQMEQIQESLAEAMDTPDCPECGSTADLLSVSTYNDEDGLPDTIHREIRCAAGHELTLIYRFDEYVPGVNDG